MSQDTKAAAKTAGDAPAVTSSKRPLIIANMTAGQIDFPIGKYSRVADQKGSTGHSIKYLRLMAGINFIDKCVLGQKRHDLTDEEYEALTGHPDYKRLRDQRHIREYKSIGAIESSERAGIVTISSDTAHLERWKVDADEPTKLAIAARLQELSESGLANDERSAPEHLHRPGMSVVM